MKTLEEYMQMLGFTYKANKGGTYYWQKFNGIYKSQMGIKEAEDFYRHSIYYKEMIDE